MTDTLHYDVRGSGPALLVIPGGSGHPMGLEHMTEALADRFTVIVHDPLGLAHGRLGLPVPEQRVQAWSDGARRVLDEALPEGESAYVLGTSAGGIAALDLLARHPERLRHVVAHEPPCVGVLPDGARHRAMFAEVYDTYRAAGLAAAAARMTAGLAEERPEQPPAGEPLPPEEELADPMALFLTRVLIPFTSYVPGPTGPTPLTVAAGTDSRGQLLYRTAESTAARTRGDFVEFPGGHLGPLERPAEFADRLARTLRPEPVTEAGT
ncbi:alpha/beta hydrolase [Streptomyces sp. CC219B]|uniref:alpha/beta fold hydrolase n=1 Tax=Streptomyces sp. CC219B TaxID=3044574 RepID=UPI0024A91901|nr:alpha/beta hydrolase [Streptomyces sp. CC219B]